MIKLDPIRLDKVWGYENWIASVHPAARHENFYNACSTYPLLIKVIQADDTLSVQVHPDDEAALKLEGEGNVGKTECWYVLDAASDAKLVFGLKKNSDGIYSSDELASAIKNNEFEKYLNFVNVKKGDFVFIPSGTVHAIGGGLRLLEVQQSCDLTYRLYDWGRPREVHVEKGLKVIKEDSLIPVAPFKGEFECRYFSLEEIEVKGGYSMLCSEDKEKSCSWQMIFCLEGSGTIKNSDGQKFDFNKEDIFAVSPGEKITVEGKARIIKIKCS